VAVGKLAFRKNCSAFRRVEPQEMFGFGREYFVERAVAASSTELSPLGRSSELASMASIQNRERRYAADWPRRVVAAAQFGCSAAINNLPNKNTLRPNTPKPI